MVEDPDPTTHKTAPWRRTAPKRGPERRLVRTIPEKPKARSTHNKQRQSLRVSEAGKTRAAQETQDVERPRTQNVTGGNCSPSRGKKIEPVENTCRPVSTREVLETNRHWGLGLHRGPDEEVRPLEKSLLCPLRSRGGEASAPPRFQERPARCPGSEVPNPTAALPGSTSL